MRRRLAIVCALIAYASHDYGELLEPRSGLRLKYGTDGTTLVVNEDGSQKVTADGSTFTLRNRDFNTLSFRSNVVLLWEWRRAARCSSSGSRRCRTRRSSAIT